mmetsp:Transcript_15470/g.46402  ORF Transcript_15470/g.46402 Transcript_15470/m.46402 type:complete len:125 (-) Transcript_15470:62-436(-)
MAEQCRYMVIGSQQFSSSGQLIARERFRFFVELKFDQGFSHTGGTPEGVFVRDAKRCHHSVVDHALEDERFVMPPKIAEAHRYISLSDTRGSFVVRPIATVQRQIGLEQRKRLFVSSNQIKSGP